MVSSSSPVLMNSSGIARSGPKTDAFRPKLPSDPFDILENRSQWIVHHDELLEKLRSKDGMTRNVILILGEPPQPELTSLLDASSLRDSLLLIVTSSLPQPLVVPSKPSPFVQILRLLSPMGLQEPGAQHLLSVLQRAEVIARQWRKQPEAFRRCSQFRESQPGGAFTVPEDYGFSPMNNPSHSLLSNYNYDVAASSPAKSASARTDGSHFSLLGRPGGRSFDVLINFIPSSLSDRSILKHIILTTTLSQTFISPPTNPFQLSSRISNSQSQPSLRAPSPSSRKQSRRSTYSVSSFSRRFSSLLTSSEVSLSEQKVRQADPTPVVTLSDDNILSRSSRLSSRRHSSHSSVPGAPISSKTVALMSELKSTRSHIIHVLPLSVPTSNSIPSSQASRSRIPLSGLSSSGVHRPRSQIEDQIRRDGKSKLLESIERFLRSYSYPSSSAHNVCHSSTSLRSSTPSSLLSLSSASSVSGSESDVHDSMASYVQNERPVAYVVSAGMLCHRPTVSNQPHPSVQHDSPAMVVEMLLLGLLDCSHSSPSLSHDGSPTLSTPLLDFVTAASRPKVWIGQPNDVVVKWDAGVNRTADVQEANEVKTRVTPTGSTYRTEKQEHVSDGWLQDWANLRGTIAPNSNSEREAGTSSASGTSTTSSGASSGDESPNTTATSSIEGSRELPRKAEVKTGNSRSSLTAKLRRVSSGWNRWKSVSGL